MLKRNAKIAEKTTALRGKFFPSITEDMLWNRKRQDGFTTIPRTMPIIMNIIDELTKGSPASSTYFTLWCRTYDEMYVALTNHSDLAFQSGFSGQRSTRTWNDRMTKLADFGFIAVCAGARGTLSHALILNPHIVIRKLFEQKTPGLTHSHYNALLERANEIGAKDIDSPIEVTRLELQREGS
jgi:hypothetical protein